MIEGPKRECLVSWIFLYHCILTKVTKNWDELLPMMTSGLLWSGGGNSDLLPYLYWRSLGGGGRRRFSSVVLVPHQREEDQTNYVWLLVHAAVSVGQSSVQNLPRTRAATLLFVF